MIPHYERVKELCSDIHLRNRFSSRFATDDPGYHELVALGREGIPALLKRIDDFQKSGGQYDELAIWEPILALHEITETHGTEEHGVKHEDGFWKGHLPSLTEYWLKWGREQGIKWED